MNYKLPKTLWFIKQCDKYKTVGREDLAYLTHADDKQNKSFLKRYETAIRWSDRSRGYSKDIELNLGEVIDNKPMSGFQVGTGVGKRWATQASYIKCMDPRGFEVEIDTSNIVNLINNSTITNGLVEGECVWVWNRSNHLLVPVNSDLYEDVCRQQSFRDTTPVPSSKMKYGEAYRNLNDDCVLFLGSMENIDLDVSYSFITHIYHNDGTKYEKSETMQKNIKIKKIFIVIDPKSNNPSRIKLVEKFSSRHDVDSYARCLTPSKEELKDLILNHSYEFYCDSQYPTYVFAERTPEEHKINLNNPNEFVRKQAEKRYKHTSKYLRKVFSETIQKKIRVPNAGRDSVFIEHISVNNIDFVL